ncbi:MAG: anti-sigma factor antagonist [Candidatus Omnitrophica bacterium]|nr:anti-sigma factor antagonist [Candidatus Omnitrophota bacterium]
MKIKINYIKNIAVLTVDGKININSSKLIESVAGLLDKGVSKLIIDMQKVDFVDYNGLSVIAITYKNVLNNNSAMKLCGIAPHIQELFRVVKLDDVFEIYNDINSAVSGFEVATDGIRAKSRPGIQPLRRKFARLDMDIPVTYRLSLPGKCFATTEILTGRIENISGAGLFVRSINLLPPGSEVSVGVKLNNDQEPRYFNGVVMWLADKNLQPWLFPGMGIAFTDISYGIRENILQFIEKNATHRKG